MSEITIGKPINEYDAYEIFENGELTNMVALKKGVMNDLVSTVNSLKIQNDALINAIKNSGKPYVKEYEDRIQTLELELSNLKTTMIVPQKKILSDKIMNRSALIIKYSIQGKSYEEIITLMKEQHQIEINRMTINRTINLKDESNLERIKEIIETKKEIFEDVSIDEISNWLEKRTYKYSLMGLRKDFKNLHKTEEKVTKRQNVRPRATIGL